MCVQTQAKSAVVRANLQHGVVLPAKMRTQRQRFLTCLNAYSTSLNG